MKTKDKKKKERIPSIADEKKKKRKKDFDILSKFKIVLDISVHKGELTKEMIERIKIFVLEKWSTILLDNFKATITGVEIEPTSWRHGKQDK